MTVQRAPSHPIHIISRHAGLDETERHRYWLHRIWRPNLDSGTSVDPLLAQARRDTYTRAVFVLLNPSTADDRFDDPTTRTCMGIANRLGFSSMEIVNLYSLRSTDPRVMLADPDRIGDDTDKMLRLITHASRKTGYGLVIAGWGSHGEPERIQQVTDLIGPDRIHALAVNRDGQPRHPLYQPHATVPQPWTAPTTPGRPHGRRRGKQTAKHAAQQAAAQTAEQLLEEASA